MTEEVIVFNFLKVLIMKNVLLTALLVSSIITAYGSDIDSVDKKNVGDTIYHTFKGYDGAAEDIWFISNDNSKGFTKDYSATDTLMAGQSSDTLKLPVGSNLCIYEERAASPAFGQYDYLDIFTVVDGGDVNDEWLSIRGTTFHTWFDDMPPNLKMVDYEKFDSSSEKIPLDVLLYDCENYPNVKK